MISVGILPLFERRPSLAFTLFVHEFCRFALGFYDPFVVSQVPVVLHPGADFVLIEEPNLGEAFDDGIGLGGRDVDMVGSENLTPIVSGVAGKVSVDLVLRSVGHDHLEQHRGQLAETDLCGD